MIYNGYFRDKKDSLYKVRITTVNGNTAKEITLSGTPFVTEMDESDDTIYTPAKYQTATVEAISGDYMFDIYSGKAQDTKVELYKGDELMWVGYVRPNLYDVGFEKSREVIQIECQDALSTLQYFPYKQSDKQVRNFLYVINKVLEVCKSYKTFYVSDNTYLTSDSCILNDLYISEENFFDNKDKNETDNDVAWKCDEVLEEICQYLGLTAIADKDAVYFIDYDAIKKGDNTYWKYQVGSTTPSKVNVSFDKKITGKDYSANGATLSMDKVYNKATVKAELYDYDSVIPDLYETSKNITASSDPIPTDNKNMFIEVVQSPLGNKGDNENMIIMLNRINSVEGFDFPDGGAYNIVAIKYFNNPNYKFFKYNGTKDVTDSVTTLNYTDTKSMHGATVAKFFVQKLNKTYGTLDKILADMLGKKFTLDSWMSRNGISNISFSNYIMMVNPEDNHISNDDIEKYPYFQTTLTDTTALCLFSYTRQLLLSLFAKYSISNSTK